MRLEWMRDPEPVDVTEFSPTNASGLVRSLLPGQRVVQDEASGQYFMEYGCLISTPDDFPLFSLLERQPKP